MGDRSPTTGKISGTITAEEIRADQNANANQDTRPSIAVETGLAALRSLDKDHR